jgi:hypothetical protein
MAQPPRYDFKIRRKGGYQFASETDLEGLQYWHTAKSRPSSNPQYAANDQAEAKKLGYWVAWRTDDPYSRWKGTRGNAEVVAAQPSDKPTVHSWDAKAPVVEPVVNPETGEVRGDAWEPKEGEASDDFNF